MKDCHIEFTIGGTSGHVDLKAPTSVDGLLQWFDTLPELTPGMRAIVKVLVPPKELH